MATVTPGARARRLVVRAVIIFALASALLAVFGLFTFVFGHRDLYRIKIVNTRGESIRVNGTKGEDEAVCSPNTSLLWPKRYYRPFHSVPIAASTMKGDSIEPVRTERHDGVFVFDPMVTVYF